MSQLRIVDVEQLMPDPDVQYEWTFNQRVARVIASRFDMTKCGILDGCVLNGENTGKIGIFVGRHRLAGAIMAGVRELRVDVHPELSKPEKFQIKLARDRDRRTVRRVELFLNEVGAEEPVASEIYSITVEEFGYKIGNASGRPETIEAVNALGELYRVHPDHLRRALKFNERWKGEPQTNSGLWLRGLGAAVAQGWTESLTPASSRRLDNLIPAKVYRRAIALTTTARSASAGNSESSAIVAEELRKCARARIRVVKEEA